MPAPASDCGEDLSRILIKNDRIYTHQLFHINYTTYDVRRGQDIIHIGTDHCDIMTLGNNDSSTHPFWYARVLGIYHADVIDNHPGQAGRAKRLEFLFVRWFGTEEGWDSGWDSCRLDRVGFVPDSDPDAFGFLDPQDVVRGCHLIPAFTEGRTTTLLRSPSRLARNKREDDDWERFYVNR